MELRQIKGNTWALEGIELIPLYKLDDHRCILLDTGLAQEGEGLLAALEAHGLTPAGVLCSHAHVDHAGNNRMLQQTFGLPVAMTPSEAGMCASLLTLKCYFLLLSPDTVAREAGHLVHRPDMIVPERDGVFSFLGVDFQILYTPGHSAGHIAITTPDRVCYVGDALLSWEQMEAKLPYSLCHRMAKDSRERLWQADCDLLLMAHRGVISRDGLDALIDANDALIQRRAGKILELVTRPMTVSEISQAVCAKYKLLTSKPTRALRFERNIRFYLEYLIDHGDLTMETESGIAMYHLSSGAQES